MNNASVSKKLTESLSELNPSKATVSILKYINSDPAFTESEDFIEILSRILAACNAADEPSFTVVTLLHDYLRNNNVSEAMRVEIVQCGYQDALDSFPPKYLSDMSPLDDLLPSSLVKFANHEANMPKSNRISWLVDLVAILSSPFADQSATHPEELIDLLNSVDLNGCDAQSKRIYLRQAVHECSTQVLQNLDVVWVLDSAEERLAKFVNLGSLVASFDPGYEFVIQQADRITNFSRDYPYRSLVILLRYLKIVATLGFVSAASFVQHLEDSAPQDQNNFQSVQLDRTHLESFVGDVQDATKGKFFPYAKELRHIEYLVSSGLTQIALTLLDHTSLDTIYPHKKWAASLRALAEFISIGASSHRRSSKDVGKVPEFSLSDLSTRFHKVLPLTRLEIVLDLINKISVLNRDAVLGMAAEIYTVESTVIKEMDRTDEPRLDLLGSLLLLVQCGRIFDQRLTVRCVRLLRQIIEKTGGGLSREIVHRLATLEAEALYSLGRDREVCECVRTAMECNGSGFGDYQQEDVALLSYLLRSIVNMNAESELENFVCVDRLKVVLTAEDVTAADRLDVALACLRIHVKLGNRTEAKSLSNLLAQWSANAPEDPKLLRATTVADAFLRI